MTEALTTGQQAAERRRPSPEARACIEDYLRLMLEANERVNLTNITDWEAARLLHIEDSLAALPFIPEGVSSMGDLGSGCGFPGVALAIASGIPTVLIEAKKKKALALQKIIDAMGLAALVRVEAKRAEDLGAVESFDIITARAVAPLPSLLELASPLLRTGGRLVAYKGPRETTPQKSEPGNEKSDFKKESSSSPRLCEKLGYSQPVIEEYRLSDGITQRALLVYEKTHAPQVVLPRRPGMAQKRPYA